MKKYILKLSLVAVCLCLLAACEKEPNINANTNNIQNKDTIANQENPYDFEGYIVGYDACSRITAWLPKGYVLISSDLKDTLLTYNLPDSLFNFPKGCFFYTTMTGLVPLQEHNRFAFKFAMNYSITPEAELEAYPCLHYYPESMDFMNATQVIIRDCAIINH